MIQLRPFWPTTKTDRSPLTARRSWRAGLRITCRRVSGAITVSRAGRWRRARITRVRRARPPPGYRKDQSHASGTYRPACSPARPRGAAVAAVEARGAAVARARLQSATGLGGPWSTWGCGSPPSLSPPARPRAVLRSPRASPGRGRRATRQGRGSGPPGGGAGRGRPGPGPARCRPAATAHWAGTRSPPAGSPRRAPAARATRAASRQVGA